MPTPTPNITPTLVQRAGMPRFLRKPFLGEQGTRRGNITTHLILSLSLSLSFSLSLSLSLSPLSL
jgi:hypothetical protein